MFNFLKVIWRIVFKTVIVFCALSFLSVLLYKWVPVYFTPLMIIRSVEQKITDKPITCKHSWVSIDKISPKLQLAVVCSEDQNYLKHSGFDFGAIEKAMNGNKDGKRFRGGSTITQQTAKNVFLWPARSYFRKGLEAWFTLLIEVLWSKQRIMEVYLNSIEMGNGIYGAEEAARFWFNKSAVSLTKDEASAIASILPNPLKYKANASTTYITKRKAWVKQQMDFWGNQLDYDKYNDTTK